MISKKKKTFQKLVQIMKLKIYISVSNPQNKNAECTERNSLKLSSHTHSATERLPYEFFEDLNFDMRKV